MAEYGFGRQAIAGEAGVQYTLSYDVTNFTTGTSGTGVGSVRIGTAAGFSDNLNQPITSNGSKSHNFTPTTDTFWLEFYITDPNADTGAQYEVDNVDIPGTDLVVIKEGGLAQFIAAEARTAEGMRDWLDDLGHMQNPYKTPYLSELEKDYGLNPNSSLSEADRRDQVAAVKYKKAGKGSIDDMQIALDRAFPDGDLVVYQNDPAQNVVDIRSENLVIDGDMEQTGVTPPWVVGNSGTLTKQTTTPKVGLRYLRIARNGVNNPYAEQNSILEVGEKYRFTGWARSDGSAFPALVIAGQTVWQGTLSTEWQRIDVEDTTESSGTLRLTSTTSTGTEYTEWDDISITQNGVLIVNGALYDVITDWRVACGEVGNRLDYPADKGAFCGEEFAQCGENFGIRKSLIDYQLPTESSQWPLVFFVGGQARYYSLLIDGDMDRSDVAAWSTGGGAALSKQSGDPKQGPYNLRVTDAGSGYAQQTILTIGEKYRVIGRYRSDGSSTASVTSGGGTLATTTLSAWTKFDFEFTATATTIELDKSGAGAYAEFDEVQVTPVDQVINEMECGEALAQCGEPQAVAGSYVSGTLLSIDSVDIPLSRKEDLERLILSVKPMHSWGKIFIKYT